MTTKPRILTTSIATLLAPPRPRGDVDDPTVPPTGDDDGPAPDWDAFEEGLRAQGKSDSTDDGNRHPAEKKPPEKKEAEKKPEVKEGEKKPEAKKEADKKPPEEKKPEAKKPEAKPEAKEAKKEGEKKPDAKKEADKKGGDDDDDADKDIDDLKLKPNAPEEVRNNFKALQGKTKEARAAQRKAEARVKELEEGMARGPANGELPKEFKERMEKLEKENMAFFTERSGVFHEKYAKPIETARTTLKDFLVAHKMPAALAEAAIKEGDDWKRWDEVKGYLNEGDNEEMADLRRTVRAAMREHRKAADDLRSEQPKYLEEKAKADTEEIKGFWGGAAEHSKELMKDKEFGRPKEVPDDATDDQKAVIEKHNASVKERSERTANMIGKAVMGRDPKAAAEIAFNAYRAEWLQEERDELQAERDELQARVEELEGMVGKSRRAGEIGRKPAPVASPKKPDGSGALVGMKAGDAMDAAFAEWKAARS